MSLISVAYTLTLLVLSSVVADNSTYLYPILFTHYDAYTVDNTYVVKYYEITLCDTPNNNYNQLQFEIIVQDNFDCNSEKIIALQISPIKGNFSQGHTITSYNNNGGDLIGYCTVIVDRSNINTNTLYLRATGVGESSFASIRVSYVNNKPVTNYPYSIEPFDGTIVDNVYYNSTKQYWFYDNVNKVKYQEYQYFVFNYCKQSNLDVKSINVIVAGVVNEPDSLFNQGGCPLTYAQGSECRKFSNSNGWSNFDTLPFSVGEFGKTPNGDASNGVRCYVRGMGGDANQINYYSIQAICTY